MKKLFIYMVTVCMGLAHTADANFLKKLKKQAEEAVERSILKKAGEAVSEETEKAIDGVTGSGEEEAPAEAPPAIASQPTGQSGQMPPVMNPFGSGEAPDNVQDAYAFAWEFKTKMTIEGKKKKDNGEFEMNYFINKDNDYFAIEYENPDIKKSGGSARMVFDFKSGAMVMLSEFNGQKMGMVNSIQDPTKAKIEDKDLNYTYEEVGTKTILGFECYGMKVENPENVATLWFTLDAPVNFSAFFAFSSDAAPKGFSDPQLFDILKEEALLMEMDATDKKRKQNMRMTAVSLEEKPNTFQTGEYSFMKLPFMK